MPMYTSFQFKQLSKKEKELHLRINGTFIKKDSKKRKWYLCFEGYFVAVIGESKRKKDYEVFSMISIYIPPLIAQLAQERNIVTL